MTISMENYYFSSDTEQDKTEWQWVENYSFSSGTGQDKTEWQSVWRITITVWRLDKIKLNDNH